MANAAQRLVPVLLATLFLVFSTPARSVTYATPTGLNFPIDDDKTLSVRAPINATGTIASLVVRIAITHTWLGDLVISLRGPDGTEINLSHRPGVTLAGEFGDSSNLSATTPIVFDDLAPTPAEDMGLGCVGTDKVVGQDCVGIFAPEDPLSSFQGKDIGGEWVLLISDRSAGDTGVLDSFAFVVELGTAPPPAPGPTGGRLENPQPNAFASGIGLISGWKCTANSIEFEFIGEQPFATQRIEAAYGSFRGDTQSVCGDTDNGYGATINFNKLGNGQHTVRVLADGVEFGRATFTVTTLGTDFLSGASGTFPIQNFPSAGSNIVLGWQQSAQNFVIQGRQLAATQQDDLAKEPTEVLAATTGNLENPQPNAFASGIGLISGWKCTANRIEFEFVGEQPFATQRIEAAYGSFRGDTLANCGDTDNGYGATINFNRLGDGQHTVRVLADGVEFDRATFTVTTLGTDFLSGVSGAYTLQKFPNANTNVAVIWQQSSQNFVIKGVQTAPPPGPIVPPLTPVVYTGATNPAPITAAGVSEIAGGISIYVPDCEERQSGTAMTFLADTLLPLLDEKILLEVERLHDKTPSFVEGLRPVSFSYPGTCGGTVSFSGSHDNGDTWGDVNLSSFCINSGAQTTTANGSLDIRADGNPGATGPVTSALLSNLGKVQMARSDGASFSTQYNGMKYTYGRPGQAPTVGSPDKLTLTQALIRNNLTDETTKVANVSASVGYQSPVPAPTALGTGTVQVAGQATVFFPNTGYVTVKTTTPMVYERPNAELESIGVTVTGASNGTVKVQVSPTDPGVFVVTIPAAPTYGTAVDCSEFNGESTLQLIDLAIQRIQSGF